MTETRRLKNVVIFIQIIHFTIQFHAKKLHLFFETEFNQYCKKYTPATYPVNFQVNMFLVGVKINLHCTNFRQWWTASWSIGKANVCIFLFICVKTFLFWRRRKFWLIVWTSLSVFEIFHFNWNFWKFNYFVAFWYFH